MTITSYPKGVDVSHYQSEIDWQILKQNIDFVYVKATEGADIVDESFATHIANARAAGLPVGTYHFFHPKDSVQSQVDLFIKTVGALQVGDLPPVLDIENPKEWAAYSMAERTAFVQDWLTQVSQKLNTNPILYMSSSFVAEILGNAVFLVDYPFWVADYTTASKPQVPAPFPFWTFWQYSEAGTAPGISGTVDLDYFNGSLTQLIKFRKGPTSVPARIAAFVARAWNWIWL